MAEEIGTEQKLSPLERAKLAKAEAEKRKQEQAEQAEAERLAAEKSVEDSAREQAEQRAQAETKVGECRSIVDAKQVECDEIAAMAAEGGDDEFVAAMAEAQAEAQTALDAAQLELQQAESALAVLSDSVKTESVPAGDLGEDLQTKVEDSVETEQALTVVDIFDKAYDDSRGLPKFDFNELLSGKGDGYAESVGKLLAEVGTDTEGRSAALKEKVSKLPELWSRLNTSLKKLEDSFKAEFGVTILKGLFEKSERNPPSSEEKAVIPAMVKFIESSPDMAEFAQTSKEIADLNQEKLKLGLAQLAKDKEISPGAVKHEVINYAADKALGEVSQDYRGFHDYNADKSKEKKPRSTTQTIDDAGLSLRQSYSYVSRSASYLKIA